MGPGRPCRATAGGCSPARTGIAPRRCVASPRLHRFKHLPYIALEIDAADLAILESTAEVGSIQEDELDAMEHVLYLVDTLPIASVNLSLGGRTYSSTEACDAASPAMKAAIDDLRAAGVLTVIASGNHGKPSEIATPGCISSAVSVGAGDANNTVRSFSNGGAWLTTLAPGLYIRSAVPGGGFTDKHGTSMAAPHVAGAVAALRSAVPEAGPEQIRTALIDSGLPVFDAQRFDHAHASS